MKVFDHSVAIVGPAIALVAWSIIVWVWMYMTRIPAMFAVNMKPDTNAPSRSQMSTLPSKVRSKAVNYGHLMEQPTIFYTIVLSLALLGKIYPLRSLRKTNFAESCTNAEVLDTSQLVRDTISNLFFLSELK